MEEIVSGFFRAIGFILAEIFFNTICYWVGWPLCKVLTFGNYPRPQTSSFGLERNQSGTWCSIVGLLTIVFVFYYVVMSYNQQAGV